MPEILTIPAVQIPLRAVAILLIVLVAQIPLLYGLIKISAHIHARVGPMYPGRFHGIGWPVAEALKWIQKESIIPRSADRVVFVLAPIVSLLPAVLIFAAIPIGPGIAAAAMDLSLFYVLAVASIGPIGIVMAGYASSSKFTLIGGLRGIGQVIAYELPVILAALSIAMLAGSLSLTEIVAAQDPIPYVLWPLPFGLIAFAIFVLAAMSEAMWAPFDMPVAESEIVFGPFTEYSGMRFIFFMMSEFAFLLGLAAVATVLFLGGWNGPFLPPVAWFVIKVSALMVFFIWVRFTFPRLREDQLQKFAWKVLIEIGFVNVLAIAFYRVLLT